MQPCRTYAFTTTTNGTLQVTLSWSGGVDLDLELWRGTTRVISTLGGAGTAESMSVSLTPGSYEVRVVYFSGTSGQNYQLQIIRPE